MGRKSRQKGKSGEREVATAFRAIFGDGVKRGWQARQGCDAPDVDGTPFWIEAKRHKKVNIHAAVRQATADRDLANDRRPIAVVARNDNEKATATMMLEDFLILVRLVHQAGGLEVNLPALPASPVALPAGDFDLE